MKQMIFKPVLLTLFFITFFSSFSFSQSIDSLLASNTSESEEIFTREENARFPSLFRLFSALIITGILIGFFYFFLKNIQLKNSSKSASNIDVLEEKVLGYSGKMCIVRVSGNVFLIGVGKDGVNHIHTFTDAETIDLLAGYDEGHIGNSLGSFKNVINSFMSKYKEKKS